MAFTTIGGFLRKVASSSNGLGGIVVATDSSDPLVVEGKTVEQTDFIYTDGLLTGYTEDGVEWTIARNADGTIDSITSA